MTEPATLTIAEGADYMLYCMRCSLVKPGTVAHTVATPREMGAHILRHLELDHSLRIVAGDLDFDGEAGFFVGTLEWRHQIREAKRERDQARRLAYWLAVALRDGPSKATGQWIKKALEWEKLYE